MLFADKSVGSIAYTFGKLPNAGPDESITMYPFCQLPDSAEARRKIAKTWFEGAIDTVIGKSSETITDSKGQTFRISGSYADFRKEYYAVSVTPLLTDYDLKQYRIVPQGLWKVYRSTKTGEIISITIYPRENPFLFLRIHPSSDKIKGSKSFIDICLLNVYVLKDAPVNLPLKRLYSMSLSDLRSITPDNIPWNLFEPPLFLNGAQLMSNIIQQRSYRLVDLPNGCFDKTGTAVHVDNGSPQTAREIMPLLRIDQQPSQVSGGVDDAGFAKWVIDGIIRPVAGEGTILESLKLRTDTSVIYCGEETPLFFKLDWIRNLGAAALSLNVKRTVYPGDSGLDVTVCPFALTNAVPSLFNRSHTSYFAFSGYEKYAGYKIEYLQALLYYLTIMEPGHFYLGCLNRSVEGKPFRQYDRIAVFLPYFDDWGRFHIDIFSGKDIIPLETFVAENKGVHAALIRVRIPESGFFHP